VPPGIAKLRGSRETGGPTLQAKLAPRTTGQHTVAESECGRAGVGLLRLNNPRAGRRVRRADGGPCRGVGEAGSGEPLDALTQPGRLDHTSIAGRATTDPPGSARRAAPPVVVGRWMGVSPRGGDDEPGAVGPIVAVP